MIEEILKEIYEILRLTLYLSFRVVKENILHLSGIGGILMPLIMMNLAKNRERFICWSAATPVHARRSLSADAWSSFGGGLERGV